MKKIGIIGGGNIGEALIAGLTSGGIAPRSIFVANRRLERSKELAEKYDVSTTENPVEAVEGAEVVFLCVKPKSILGIIDEISSVLDDNEMETIVVSMAAGITTAAMEKNFSAGTPAIRVMPNTPMLVQKGTCAIAAGRFAHEEHLHIVEELLAMTGTVVVVAESDIDAVTAVSGSGPAYIFLIAEAMIDAAVNLGISRGEAEQLAVATIEGAAAMMVHGEDSPAELRAKVTSPGGTTSMATRALEENGIRKAFFTAMEDCRDRSVELGLTLQTGVHGGDSSHVQDQDS